MSNQFNTTPPSGGMPMVGRPIINANIDVSNRIEANDINTVILHTFDDIAEVLSKHCGPYGEFAMIADPANRVAEPVFTKDGIGIVRAIEYMSVMQEYVRNTLAYMGSRIETAAGDGTTSSMIICATALQSLISSVGDKTIPILGKGNTIFSYNELMSTYRKFTDAVIAVLQMYGKLPSLELVDYTTEEKREAVWRIAYSQAYTSSHGNVELSRAVAQLFADTPKEAWDYLYIDKCKYESDKLYQVAVDDSQYTVENVMVWPTGMLTEDMGTARERENVSIDLSGICPSVDHQYLDGYELYEKICKKIESGEEYVLICPAMIDGATTNALNEQFAKYPNHNVFIVKLQVNDPRLNDIICMKTLNNTFGVVSTFTGSYRYSGGDLKITKGLYQNDNGSKLNPMVNDPNYPALNTMLTNLDKVIDQIKSQVANRTLNADVANLQKLRLKLLVSRRTYFLIGGSAYDSAAAVDVVIDAILAVKNSLKKGFCLGGNKTLYTVLHDYFDDVLRESEPLSDKEKMIYDMYREMFRIGIEKVHEANVRWFDEEHTRPKFDYHNSFDLVQYASLSGSARLNEPWKVGINALFENLNQAWESSLKINAPIIQPMSADEELIRRFGELAIKFVKTCRIISPGGLVSNDKIDTI